MVRRLHGEDTSRAQLVAELIVKLVLISSLLVSKDHTDWQEYFGGRLDWAFCLMQRKNMNNLLHFSLV